MPVTVSAAGPALQDLLFLRPAASRLPLLRYHLSRSPLVRRRPSRFVTRSPSDERVAVTEVSRELNQYVGNGNGRSGGFEYKEVVNRSTNGRIEVILNGNGSSSFSLLREPNLPRWTEKRRTALTTICFYNANDKLKPSSSGDEKGSKLERSVLSRWDVPWSWPTVSLTMLACAVSFVLTGLVEASLLSYLGFEERKLSLDEKAELLFASQFFVTVVVLGVIYGIINTFQPMPDDVFRYDLKKPFDLRDGWLLWAGFGLLGALVAIALTGLVLNIIRGENPERETDALIRLLPLIGSSGLSTACLVGITGVLAPVLEETVFRGFLMVSLTKYVPTPVSVLISAAVFAVAHLTPGEFPQLFILGIALGFSYAQTRNLLTPITIHALWNSGVILLLTFLQAQGYDIRELVQAS